MDYPLKAYETICWESTKDGKILCNLCPRNCVLNEGQRGFCFVRQNIGGKMVLTTYGRSSGFCIDPVEKKPLNHFYPGSSILSFGTAGCNLGCKFCQNWDISKSKEWDRLTDQASPEKIARVAKELGCKSVAFTYNDPVIFAEYAIDIAKACHEIGVKTVAVTAGYITKEARGVFYEHMDAANVDLKAFSEEFYSKITLSHLQPVLDTLIFLKKETNVWFEITNLVIPRENDSEDEFKRMTEWIVKNLGDDVPIHFTAFHPDYKMMNNPPTPEATLRKARKIALEAGIKFTYVGNVHDKEGSSTYCPQCREVLIERDWYEIGKYDLKGSVCKNCAAVLPGHFDENKGTWGARRMPIQLSSYS